MQHTTRFIFRQILALAALVLALPVFAQAGYSLVQPPQPTDNPAKIEVIDFFYYTCPHCKSLSVPMAAWEKKLPDDVYVRKIHVSFGNPAITNLSRLYYALEATGDLARLDQEVFKALHEQRVNLAMEGKMMEWLAKQGVNTQKFGEAYKSFGVESKVRRADQLSQSYRIQGVPAIIIDGKYLLEPNSPEKLLALTDELIAKVRAERAAKKK